MDMIDGGLDPAEFATTAERAVAACAALDHRGRAARLAEDGLLGVLADEASGGLGLGLPFAVPVMTAAGSGDLAFPLMETLLLSRALAAGNADLAAALVAGEATGTIAWQGMVELEGGRLRGVVARVPLASQSDWVLVRLRNGGAALVASGSATIQPGITLDVTVPEETLSLQGTEPALVLDAAGWAALEADALVLRAAAIMGAAETCVALAAEHVGNRRQFGKPLVAYQAIRHHLARHKLGVEGIRGAITRATWEGQGVLPRQAAFLAAVTHGPLIAEGAVQLFGGMGFTWEVPVHRYMRRIRALEAQGEALRLRESVAADFIAAA